MVFVRCLYYTCQAQWISHSSLWWWGRLDHVFFFSISFHSNSPEGHYQLLCHQVWCSSVGLIKPVVMEDILYDLHSGKKHINIGSGSLHFPVQGSFHLSLAKVVFVLFCHNLSTDDHAWTSIFKKFRVNSA